MAWSMPPAGQWNAGMGSMAMAPNMTPTMAPTMASAMGPDMNMGSYSAEQWAAMQHQNWQQWAQWQQQYAQWQSQYGEKYAEQMQAMQNMGPMPPLPTSSNAPPPPPDHPPPPPPPHENNQPLYGQPQVQVPVQPQVQVLVQPQVQPQVQMPPTPAPMQIQTVQRSANAGYNNFNTGNNQNWPPSELRPDATQPSVNTEALNKLAEEERLFDIQFQKWEEQIKEWRKENINHPDKQAYNDYEQKFESCRVQLLERRQQMKQKRARLMTNTPQAVKPAVTGNNNISTAMPPQQTANSNYNNQNIQSQTIQQSKPPQNYSNQNNTQYQQYNHRSQSGVTNNITVDLQSSFESHQRKENYSSAHANKSSFLPSSQSKGIPGLDLVPEVEKAAAVVNKDVIDITEDYAEQQPDYTKISKGINNILGDEKIMNILSMVRGHGTPDGRNNQNANVPSVPNAAIINPSVPQNNQWAGSNNTTQSNQWAGATNTTQNQFAAAPTNNTSYNNQQYGNRQNMPYNGMPPYGMQQNPPAPAQYYGNAQYAGQTVPPNLAQPAPQSAPKSAIPSLMSFNVPPPENVAQKDNREVYDTKNQEPKSKWVEEPMFTPSIIVEYEHKPLRLKAREFIEPVHMFDYNHKSKDEEKKVNFDNEVEELFTRKPRRVEDDRSTFDRGDRIPRDMLYRDYERRPADDVREDRDRMMRGPPRDDYFERRRIDIRNDSRRRDDREKYSRREESYRDREMNRDRHRDFRQEDRNVRSRSHEKESRKRGRSKDVEPSENSNKKSKEAIEKDKKSETPKPVVMIDDILEPPGRDIRPEKIVIILRGPPGSGKSYLAKLIRDREAEYGGTARIMSIDDYFMQEGEFEEKDPVTGKMVRKPSLKYEYDEKQEETYLNSLKRAFKRSLTDGYFTFLILDAVNDHLKSYADVWNFARQNGFQVYVCTMELDANTCYKRNIHNRTLEDIQVICSRFYTTPAHQIELNPTTLLQNANIPEVHMEDVSNEDIEPEVTEVEHGFTSKWESMDDVVQLARLDGTNKPLRPSQLSMEDYLQIDEWKPNIAKPGKKTVRWADIEERRQQEKMRAIGFVVGQTDWNRMTDPTMGSSALTQTKYIERVRRF